MNPYKLLVLCTGNSCRSQIAEAYLRTFSNGRAAVFSAGVEVHGLNANAVRIMREDGIDISHQTSNHVDEYASLEFDFVITVCDNAKEHCPYFPARINLFHQNFPDPAKAYGTDQEIMEHFRLVRNMIKTYCYEFALRYLNDPKSDLS